MYKLCSEDGGQEGNVRGDFNKAVELLTVCKMHSSLQQVRSLVDVVL